MSNTARTLRNRSSRYSSPANFTSNTATPPPSTQVTAGNKTVQHGKDEESGSKAWVEPVVRPPAASFEDTKGLERLGVLEHMQPLGIGPNVKLLQRLKVNYNRPSLSARATPGVSEGVSSPLVAPVMMDPASPVESDFLPDVQPLLLEAQRSPCSPERQQQMPETTVVVTSPPRGRPTKVEAQEAIQITQGQSVPSPSSKRQRRYSRTSVVNGTPQKSDREAQLHDMLNVAIQRAHANDSHEVAAGLTRLRDQMQTDQEAVAAVESILKNRTNPPRQQFKVFQNIVKKGKRHYQREAETAMSYSRSRSESPEEPYADSKNTVVRPHSSPLRYPSADRNERVSTIEHDTSMPHAIHQRPPPSSRSGQSDAEMADELLEPVTIRNNYAQSPFNPRKRQRTASHSTVSSLSSAKSVANDFARAGMQGPTEASKEQPARSAGQRQAPARAAASRGSRLSGSDHPTYHQLELSTTKQSGEHVRKKPRSDFASKPAIEQEVLEARRRAFEQSSEQDYNYIPRPTQHIRLRVQGLPKHFETGPPSPAIHSNPVPTSSAEVANLSSTSISHDKSSNGDMRKKPRDELELVSSGSRLSSPLSSISPPPPPNLSVITVAAAASTRSNTPRTAREVTSLTNRKQAKTIHSPRKSKVRSSATNTATHLHTGIDVDSIEATDMDGAEDESNEEVCQLCGEGGTLLCCDGCPNAYHFHCLDPPLDPNVELDGDWFCPECLRSTGVAHPTGLLGPMVLKMDQSITRNYSLPPQIQSFYEGVSVGSEGEYIETIPATQKNNHKKNREGFIEAQNYKDPLDNKEKPRLCYKCGTGTGGTRDIVPCDYCTNQWHLDCLGRSTAPQRVRDGKPIPWRCPLHVRDDYEANARDPTAEPGAMGRRPKLRMPKDRQLISLEELAVEHGTLGKHRPVRQWIPNSGVVEVQLIPEVDIDFKKEQFGRSVVRVTEETIRVDFLNRARAAYHNDLSFSKALNIADRHAVFHAGEWRPTAEHRPRVLLEEDQDLVLKRMDDSERLAVEALLQFGDTSLSNPTQINGGYCVSDASARSDVIMRLIEKLDLSAEEFDKLSSAGNDEQIDVFNSLLQSRATIQGEILVQPSRTSSRASSRNVINGVSRKMSPLLAGIKVRSSPCLSKLNGTLGHDHGTDADSMSEMQR